MHNEHSSPFEPSSTTKRGWHLYNGIEGTELIATAATQSSLLTEIDTLISGGSTGFCVRAR